MKPMNPVLDAEIHDHIVKGIQQAAGALFIEHTRENDDEFLQTVIKLIPAYAKGKTEYEILAELSTLLYCSNIFIPKIKPGYPGWHGTAVERIHKLVDGNILDYLSLDYRTENLQRIYVDLDIDTSHLESENYYLVYFTPMTVA